MIALTKQTNPNWKAYFFVTDEKPFDKELQQMLHKHNDPRLVYLDVPISHRPAVSLTHGKVVFFIRFNIFHAGNIRTIAFSLNIFLLCDFIQFTVIDAGYTATDYAIAKVLADPQCRWISLSNGDNAYGSRVVENVLHGEFLLYIFHRGRVSL